MTIRTAAKTSAVLGVISLVAGVVGALALTDIGHGEVDLWLEWRALQIAMILIFAFHVAALSTLRRVLRDGTV